MITGSEIKTKFEEALENSYVTVSWIPISKKNDNETGDLNFTSGTAQTIKIRFNNADDRYFHAPQGLKYDAPSFFFTKVEYNIKRDDLISYKGQKFRVDAINIYSVLDVDCFQKCIVYLLE